MEKIKIESYKYIAIDGKEFYDKEQCIKYEDILLLLKNISYKEEYTSKKWSSAKNLFIEEFDALLQEDEGETKIEFFLNKLIEKYNVLYIPNKIKETLQSFNELCLYWEPILENDKEELWVYDDENSERFVSVNGLIKEFNEKINFLKDLKE